MAPPPVPEIRLKQIATDACDSALSSTDSYVHSSTPGWNATIINTILKSLISETSTPDSPPKYKFAVNSTIMQHSHPLTSSSSASTTTDAESNTTATDSSATPSADEATTNGSSESQSGTASSKPRAGRRGMHSAAGAYWNNERDGLWNFKYEGAERKGMDVVVSVIWIGI
ncbi:hypothetical protein H2201_008623 [Coniosporium apollinis]|uniref:Dynein light chain n=1 Tax=Coniosporium apollinis TaxID=61459 RepID=A0ABQ9NGJ5_9PEZI|nr:hypothetical protein H2201_008623 [Coniosporium apollinis]